MTICITKCIELCPRSHLTKLQKQAAAKKALRIEKIGDLLRSKGFLWVATSNAFMGGWQQAGNVLRLEAEGPWMGDIREMWEGTVSGNQFNRKTFDLRLEN